MGTVLCDLVVSLNAYILYQLCKWFVVDPDQTRRKSTFVADPVPPKTAMTAPNVQSPGPSSSTAGVDVTLGGDTTSAYEVPAYTSPVPDKAPTSAYDEY